MKGKIEIVCDDNGTHLSVNVRGERASDRIFVVHALGKALQLEPVDYMVMALAESDGVLDEAAVPSISIDRDELARQLKEEHSES